MMWIFITSDEMLISFWGKGRGSRGNFISIQSCALKETIFILFTLTSTKKHQKKKNQIYPNPARGWRWWRKAVIILKLTFLNLGKTSTCTLTNLHLNSALLQEHNHTRGLILMLHILFIFVDDSFWCERKYSKDRPFFGTLKAGQTK